MSDPIRPTFSSGVYYKDPRAALKWLEQAFGFETVMVVENPDGTIGHSEMRFGDGLIMIGREWDARHQSPASIGGINTQALHVQVRDGIDACFERAKAAGATVLREPADQFYGDRTFMVADPEGHVWSFGQVLKVMSHADMEAAEPGVTIKDRL